MVKSTYELLNSARQRMLEGENDLMLAVYNRATTQNIPSSFIKLHKITNGYMMLSMAKHSPVHYFDLLKQAKRDADTNEQYRAEYTAALATLVRIKDMFLRDVAINYFSEVCTCSWQSNYGKSLDELYMYLDKNIDDITNNDRYGLATYMSGCDIKKLRRDLKTVQAYCLNMLLMYVTHKSTHYEGKTYTANTVIYDDFAYTQVNSHDNYSHNAVARPRICQVIKEEYYPDYLQAFKALKKELNISTEQELKQEVGRLVDRKHAKDNLEKEYFKYAKRLAKEDTERRSFYNVFGSIYPGYNSLVKPILKVCVGTDEVGSFELDTPLTRKRWLGVCNMLAWANDWSVDMVRTIMFICGCMGIGVIAYFALYAAMKTNFYLPNFSVQKHL